MTQQFPQADAAAALVVQWTLVLAAGWMARTLARRTSAATRSAVGRATLACLVAVPFVAMAANWMRVPRVNVPVISSHAGMPVETPPVRLAEATTFNPVTVRPVPAPMRELVPPVNSEAGQVPVRVGPRSPRDAVETSREWAGALVLAAAIWAWVVVSLGLLIRLLIANCLLRFRRQRAASASERILTEVAALAEKMGIPAPAVRMSTTVRGACLTGIIRPVILLPAEENYDVEPEVLVHELAHLIRGDCAWALASGIVIAVLWWHPLAWLLVRNIERDAEEACDDVVLLQGGERSRYARMLVKKAEEFGTAGLMPAMAPGLLARRSALGRRVRRLLDGRHMPKDRTSRAARRAIVCYVLVIGLASALVRGGGGAAGQRVAGPATAAGPGKTHHGRVIDAAGNPVAGADLYLLKYGSWPAVEVAGKLTSDGEGRFEFNAEIPADPSDNRYDVQTVVPGKGVGEARPESSKECVIQLIAPTRITLTVLGPDAKPLAGLKVFPVSFASMPARGAIVLGVPSVPAKRSFFMKMPIELYGPLGGVTDARGLVTFENLPRGQGFELGFDNERFARPGIINRIGLAENSEVTPPETIQLEQAATISGAVRYGPTGKGAAGLRVSAQATRNNYPPRSLSGGTATTDATGAYQITGLAGGEYNVTVYLDPDLQKQWVGTVSEAVKLEGGETQKDVDISLVKGGIVGGKVFTADTGQPIHARIRVQSGEGFEAVAGSAETGPDGSYSVRVRPGPQRVFLSVVAPEVYRQAGQQPRDVQVEEGRTASVDFLVPKREGQTVEGVVVGEDGKPVAGVAVKAEWGAVFSNPVTIKTDAAGKFRFERVPLDGQIFVDSEDVRTTESTSIAKGMGPVRLQLVRKFVVTLKGLVTDDAGKPVSDARIELSQVLGSSTLSGLGGPSISDPAGRYEIKDLHGGYEYELLATAEGHGEARERFTPKVDAKTLPTLKLFRADVSTAGVVVDESGSPVAGATAYLNDGRETKATTTDAQGKFSFTVVRGKRYVLWSVLKGQDKKSGEVDGGEGKTDLKLVLRKEE